MRPHYPFQSLKKKIREPEFMEVRKNSRIMGPESRNLYFIDDNLWLGNLASATNINLLEEKKIKYLLTINSFPLPRKIRNLSHIERKYVKVLDTPEENLLSYFEETYDFIEGGLKKGAAVLVHCYLGISRSATIVLSYLMKKKRLMLGEALQYVKSKCESIEPNPGFFEQLKLYERMQCTLDKNNVQYKMFRLHVTSHQVKGKKGVPKYYSDIIEADPLLMTPSADPTVYKCKKCRRVVARGLNEIPHVPNGKSSWTDFGANERLGEAAVCQLSYFIQPLAWMENVNVSLEGKLYCPNKICSNKLGSFDWVSGVQCPCGTKVCPGFYLIPSKVDKQNNV